MKKVLFSLAGVAALLAIPALGADMKLKAPPAPAAAPPAWDLAYGGAIMNDYIFRGITQSNHQPSVAAYFEPRYNLNANFQLYAGIAGESINFPNTAAAEIDLYAGFRPTFGPVALDFGVWYYWYPGGTCYNGPTTGCVAIADPRFIKANLSYFELYGKATYNVTDTFALGGNVYYSPSFLNSGAPGTYASGTAKYTGPALANGIGWYVSGELGYQWLGTTDVFYAVPPTYPAGIPLPSYATWNAGLGFTYKVLTLDLRYSDTNLSKSNCYAFTGDYTATLNPAAATLINPAGFESNWCGSAFIAKLSVDSTLNAH